MPTAATRSSGTRPGREVDESGSPWPAQPAGSADPDRGDRDRRRPCAASAPRACPAAVPCRTGWIGDRGCRCRAERARGRAKQQLVERVLADLQRHADLMLESRLREALTPALARWPTRSSRPAAGIRGDPARPGGPCREPRNWRASAAADAGDRVRGDAAGAEMCARPEESRWRRYLFWGIVARVEKKGEVLPRFSSSPRSSNIPSGGFACKSSSM